MIERLQGAVKTSRRQVEEAEEVAAINLAKYRKIQRDVEEAEERAEQAEQALQKVRVTNRASMSMPRGASAAPGGGGVSGLSQSF